MQIKNNNNDNDVNDNKNDDGMNILMMITW